LSPALQLIAFFDLAADNIKSAANFKRGALKTPYESQA
jgi:hypothetical protein